MLHQGGSCLESQVNHFKEKEGISPTGPGGAGQVKRMGSVIQAGLGQPLGLSGKVQATAILHKSHTNSLDVY